MTRSALSLGALVTLGTLGAALSNIGCSDDGSPSTSGASANAGSASTSDCAARCKAKATSGGGGTDACADLCAGASEADIACVESASCKTLAASDGKCPTGSGGTGGSSGGAGGQAGEACVNGQCASGTCLTQYSPPLCTKVCSTSSGDCPASLPVCKDPLNSGTGTCQKRD